LRRGHRVPLRTVDAMRVYTTSRVRGSGPPYISPMHVRVLEHGKPRDAKLNLYRKTEHGPFTAELNLADGTGARVEDMDCVRAVERVLVAVTRKTLEPIA
jgi:hypothetical protein